MRVVILAIVLAFTGVLLDTSDRPVAAASERRPDIILWLLDDWSPLPARLWTDASLTPNIAAFTTRATEFENAIATTPLCGPSRGSLLTGRYGHDHGMTGNDIHDLRNVTQIAQKMQAAGYKTAYLGKDLNNTYLKYRTRQAMLNKARYWDHYEVIWGSHEKNYDWRQFRKTGPKSSKVTWFGRDEMDLSTAVTAKRAASHVRKTARNKPIFMVISLVDGHKPLTPLRRFEGDSGCSRVAPWDGPAYMEQDVSDKPAYVRAMSRKDSGGYDLAARCEVLKTSDWAIGVVKKALSDRRRLGNALQILTADNGFLMGDHRLEGKGHAYATPVPMYARWPNVTRGHKRVVRDKVALIDLPRTFCALARCTMPKQDGRNLAPLIKGRATQVNRSYILTEMLHAARDYGVNATARPAWAGLETTLKYDDHLWAYTRYQTGEEELYDLSADPHRRQNLAGIGAHAQRLVNLRHIFEKQWSSEGMHWKAKLP